MKAFTKTKRENGISRAIIFALAIFVQLLWILGFLLFLSRYFPYVSVVASVIALIVALGLFGKDMNSAFKLSWMILILAFPLFGLMLYFLTGHSRIDRRQIRRFNVVGERIRALAMQEISDVDYGDMDLSIVNQSKYISNVAQYKAHLGSDVKYFPDAAECFRSMLKDIREAKKFIFMEYHAIENCAYFAELADVLEEKSKNGVEVRIIYDDLGSLFFINKKFAATMQKRGMACRIFNPIMPTINVLMNNRDHRKITVIDGTISYTGGFNLADEYFNLVSPYGHWKDTGVRIEGPASINLTTIFLEMWNQIEASDSEDQIKQFLRASIKAQSSDKTSLVQPFGDTPLDTENVGENIYLNIISAAKKYLYISTPYLIIDDELASALKLAARRGVDVRVMIPEIPDKKLVYKSTKSYATLLAKNGVKIYKYTPGFNHAKQVVCDDEIACCGTVNFDYRSLYFHFENGVVFTNREAVMDMRKDFESVFEQSEDATESLKNRLSFNTVIYDTVLRIISPLF